MVPYDRDLATIPSYSVPDEIASSRLPLNYNAGRLNPRSMSITTGLLLSTPSALLRPFTLAGAEMSMPPVVVVVQAVAMRMFTLARREEHKYRPPFPSLFLLLHGKQSLYDRTRTYTYTRTNTLTHYVLSPARSPSCYDVFTEQYRLVPSPRLHSPPHMPGRIDLVGSASSSTPCAIHTVYGLPAEHPQALYQ